MLFKDRTDAGRKLLQLLKKDQAVYQLLKKSEACVVSLLRGGIIVGHQIAKGLNSPNLPLVVTKIPAPERPELAIGAVCFDVVYLEKKVINSLGLNQVSIARQIMIAKEKFSSYFQRFKMSKSLISKTIKNKIVILVDDGIATGSTIRAGILFLREKKPSKIFLVIPIAPLDFEAQGIDRQFILHKDPLFSAVSQFYARFPQITDREVVNLLSPHSFHK